jgi:hypothetical protein
MRTIEDIYADIEIVKKLGLTDDSEIMDALNESANSLIEELSIDESNGVWGRAIDIEEFEDTPLTIRTEKTMGFMGFKTGF